MGVVTADEFDAAVVVAHNLAGNAEADAGALLLGGIERDENLFLGRCRNRRTFKRWLSTSLFRKITHGYYEKRYR